jgi:cysteine desulfurase
MQRGAYLDWNATTPPLDSVVEAMRDAARRAWGNASSVHAFGREALACVEDARSAVAALAKCDPRDVILTSGATEANNIALRSAFAVPSAMGRTLVTSRLEHPSVTRVAEALEREGRARVRWVNVRDDGTIDLADLQRALSEGRVELMALQHVNQETGVIQPVDEALALGKRSEVALHVDAVQAFGRIESAAQQAATRSLAGHKMRGPKGIGALIVRPGVRIAPLLVGGSQERGLRPGTVDASSAAGLAAAARHAVEGPGRWRRLAALRDELEVAICRLARGARVNGVASLRAPHVTSVSFPGWSGPELVAALDLEGIAVSSGSACSAGTAEPSATLLAMGDVEAARSTVRFSLGEDTRREDVDLALGALARILDRAAPGRPRSY